ncbi:MAG: hypothetical protein GY850_25675 [bacterium]|nr:hypothetical protein [bacterium]
MSWKILKLSLSIPLYVLIGLIPAVIMSSSTRWAILIFVAFLFVNLVLLTRKVRQVLLAVIIFDIPFSLDIYLGHNEKLIEFGGLSGWNISATTIALLILYAIWFVEISTRDVKDRGFTPVQGGLPLSIYVGFAMLSMIGAGNLQLSLMKNFMLFQIFLLYIYIIATVRTRKEVLYILTVLLLALILESTIMIWLRHTGHSIEIAGLHARIHGSRVSGTIGSPNVAGSYLSLMLAPALGLMVAGVTKYYKWLGAVAFGLGLIAITFTFSRGAWIAFTLSCLIFIMISWLRGWLSLKFPVILAVVAVVLLLFLQEVLVSRITGDDGGSAAARIPLMKLAIRIIIENPWLGVGTNNFAFVMFEYMTYELQGIWLHTVHNKYLAVCAETGIGGLLAFLWFLLSSIGKGWKCWKLQDPLLAPLALGIATAIIGHMIHSNFAMFQGRVSIQSLWLNSALVVAMCNILGTELPESNNKYLS